ncbi:hypothetical protein PWT90_09544 [Aphanocladium album]|nr:hypothetical protein PWT90_09544 [Aphanocladium album]
MVSSSHRMSVFVYHNKRSTTDELLTYAVVLTTYGTIAAELRRLEAFMKENADAGRSVDYNHTQTAAKLPLLHPTKAKYHRVILDEVQCIKNKETQTAKACYRLRANYRWCLTGTPMMHGVLELYSLLAFLHIKPYLRLGTVPSAVRHVIRQTRHPKSVAMSKLRALLKAIMLRRKKNSLLDVVYAELSPDERDYYNQLELKAQVQFSKYRRDGSIGRNYSNILVLLLWLREACCHPHLNLDVTDSTPITAEDVLDLVKQLQPNILNRIKESDAFECPICYDAVTSPQFFIPYCQRATRATNASAQCRKQDASRRQVAHRAPACRRARQCRAGGRCVAAPNRREAVALELGCRLREAEADTQRAALLEHASDGPAGLLDARGALPVVALGGSRARLASTSVQPTATADQQFLVNLTPPSHSAPAAKAAFPPPPPSQAAEVFQLKSLHSDVA